MARALIFLLLVGCPSTADVTDDDDATPPPDESVGCEPEEFTEEDLCDGDRTRDAFGDPDQFCPEFWEGIDLEQGWTTLSSRWTLDFAAVAPDEPVDHWEYRNIQGAELTADLPVDVIATQGTPCATATDEVACVAALDALRPTSGFVGGCGPAGCTADYLAWSRGDEVGVVTDGASMAAFLGSVESVPEAALQATASLEGFGWASGVLEGGAVREAVNGGFDLLGTVSVWADPFRSDIVLLHVPTAGDPTALDRALLELDCSVDL